MSDDLELERRNQPTRPNSNYEETTLSYAVHQDSPCDSVCSAQAAMNNSDGNDRLPGLAETSGGHQSGDEMHFSESSIGAVNAGRELYPESSVEMDRPRPMPHQDGEDLLPPGDMEEYNSLHSPAASRNKDIHDDGGNPANVPDSASFGCGNVPVASNSSGMTSIAKDHVTISNGIEQCDETQVASGKYGKAPPGSYHTEIDRNSVYPTSLCHKIQSDCDNNSSAASATVIKDEVHDVDKIDNVHHRHNELCIMDNVYILEPDSARRDDGVADPDCKDNNMHRLEGESAINDKAHVEPVSKAPHTADSKPVSKAPHTDHEPVSKAPHTADSKPVSKAPHTDHEPVSKAPHTADSKPVSKAPHTADSKPVSKAPHTDSEPVSKAPHTDSEPVSKAPLTDSDPVRGLWGHPAEFFLCCLGYTVGLEAVWQFPHLMSIHGGGAFLLPYFLCLMTLGIPLLYLEMCIGQYVSQGPIHVWHIAPLAAGIGYVMVAVCIMVSCYYSVFISWLLYYLFASMSPQLPWLNCVNTWNTLNCCEYRYYIDNCTSIYPSTFPDNSSCYVCPQQAIDGNTSIWQILEQKLHSYSQDHSLFNQSEDGVTNSGIIISLANTSTVSPEEEYFHNEVLDLSQSVTDLGIIQWRLLLCMILAWTIVFSSVCKSIKSLGKVVYVSTLLPYLILIGLLIKCSLLNGSKDGVLHYLHPHWYRLNDVQVWKDAAVHVLLSFGSSHGTIITLASYNRFSYNFYRTATLVPLLNCLCSVLAGCMLFSLIGHMSWHTHIPIAHISAQRTYAFGFIFVQIEFRLVFMTYPEALSVENRVMVSFFYLMMVLLGVAKVLPPVFTVITSILDIRPQLYRGRHKVTLVALIVCVIMAACSILFTTQGGLYLVEILSTYITTWPVYLLGVLECLVITWMYKFTRLQNNIWLMIGKRPGRWWLLMWGVLTPILLMLLLLYSIAVHLPLSYDGELMSGVTNLASWVLAGVLVFVVPICALYAVISHSGNCKQRMKKVTRPPKRWGPSSKFANFYNHQFRTMPDYMVSEQEETHQPIAWNRQYSIATSSDGESISTMEGVHVSPPGVQKGDNIDTGSIQWSEDENKFRGNWTGRFDFVFSALGYSVGVGNVWRFPYVVYKNGGGAFFVPYMMMLVLCGIPLFYMELALGQFASVGPITVWRASPIFKGVGYAAVMTLTLVCLYYNVFTAWSVYYIAASMTNNLPWTTCNNSWNTPDCRERSFYNQVVCTDNKTITTDDVSTWNVTTASSWDTKMSSWNDSRDTSTVSMVTSVEVENSTWCRSLTRTYPSPSAEYFFNKALAVSGGIDEPGSIQWHLALSLLFCWIITFVGLIRGVKSAGKVVYVTVLLPYLILVMLLIRFVTLDSDAHLDGIRYYVTPQWDRLSQAGVWGDAASQLFFSLGLCMGGLIALGSYNRFHYDCYRDAYLICCMDTVTSVFSGFVIFSILGVMAREKGTDVSNVVESSFALAFIVFPDAVTRLPHSTVWSLLFFIMMFMLAIDSHFLMMEAVVIAVMDEFSKYLWRRRVWVILTLCSAMFLLGLTFVTQGGIYLLVLVDAHVAAWSPLVIGILMCVAMGWIYRVDNFCENIRYMRGEAPGWWWKLMWRFVTPAVLLFILLFSWIMYKPVKMDEYEYPVWAQVLGIFMSLAPILCIPIVIAVQLIPAKQTCKETIQDMAQPDPEWGPALEKHRIACYIPSPVIPEEQIARINEWLSTGHMYEEEIADPLDDIQVDIIETQLPQMQTALEHDRPANTSYSRQGSTPAKELTKRYHSDGDSTRHSQSSITEKSLRLKRKASGLHVTFKQQLEGDIDSKDLPQNKFTKTVMKDSHTQTKATTNSSIEITSITRADIHGYNNPAFVTDIEPDQELEL